MMLLEYNKNVSFKSGECCMNDSNIEGNQNEINDKKNLFNINKIKVIIVCFSILFVFGMSYLVCAFNYSIKTIDNETDVEILLGNEYNIPEADVYLLGKKIKSKVTIDGNVDINKVGTYEITYTYKKGLVKDKYIKKIKVVEHEAPVIYLKGSENINVCPGSQYKEAGYSATDNYDGDITDKVQIIKKDNEIIYRVEDSSGNVAEAKRKIEEIDKMAPVIKVSDIKEVLLVGDEYKDKGYSATDNCDGDLTNEIVIEGTVDTTKPGAYYRTYTVKDKAGNKTTKTKTILVAKTKEEKDDIIGDIPKQIDDKIPGVIYLTFDDGPSGSGSTKAILDTLKKYNVQATFFVTSNGPDSLIKRAYDEGHTIGLHTASHNYAKIYSSDEAYFSDLERVSKRVEKITGAKSKYIRFPGGSSNTISRKYSPGIMSRLTLKIHEQGYEYYDWNIASGDAGGTTSSEQVYRNVIRNLSKKRSNMILFHDTKSFTAKALPKIIQYGLDHNYEFKAIDDNTPKIHHGVNN